MAMLKIYYKKTKTDPLTEISELRSGAWIHIDEATVEDLEKLTVLTGIEYSVLADCLDKYEIPRVEKNNSYLIVFTRYPTDQETGLYTSTLTMIVSNHLFVTICPIRCLLVQNFLEQTDKYMTLRSRKLMIQLLLKIIQEFTGQIRRVRYNIVGAEKEMIHVDSDDITIMTKHEEILNQYLSSLVSIRNVLEEITSERYAYFYEKEHELLLDCLNATKQSEELCGIVLKSIRSLRDSYQIIFTNNLHKTIKLLTALTIILSIPTMIASVYGMNVGLPLASHKFAFIYVLGFTAILSVFAIWIFRRKGWL